MAPNKDHIPLNDLERFNSARRILSEHEKDVREINWLRFKHELNGEAGKVNPDTFGADAIFTRGFVTPDMEDDFPIIANAFYKNVPECMDFKNTTTYTGHMVQNSDFRRSLAIFTMEKILSMAKKGNEYSIKLLQYLYKTYYKKEYMVLKRFSVLTEKDLLSLPRASRSDEYIENEMARLLTIAPFFKINIDASCSFPYALLNQDNEATEREEDENSERVTISKEETELLISELQEIFQNDNFDMINFQTDDYWMYDTFRELSMIHLGFSDFFRSLDMDISVQVCLIHALHIWKQLNPKQKPTAEQLQVYAYIYYLTNSACACIENAEDDVRIMLGEIDDFVLEGSQFIPNDFEKISGLKKENANQAVSKRLPEKQDPQPGTQPASNTKYDQQALIDEIDALRVRLHEMDHEKKHIAELYSDMKQRYERAEKDLLARESDREELIALREYAYNSTEEDIILTEMSRQDYIDQLKEYKVVIVGGHTNWVRQVRDLFPKWTFVNFKSTTTIDDSVVDHADHVFFYTDTLKHHVYYRFVNLVREKKIPFGYISTSNIDKGLKQMAEEL